MSQSPTNPNDALREELVAYLDGELPPDACAAVEQRIAMDEHARQELEGFDKVWNALDELPRSGVDDSFTKSTLEMTALAAEREAAALTTALPIARRRRGLALLGGCALAGLTAFAAVWGGANRQNRELIDHLGVIENLDALRTIDDFEFLANLHELASEQLTRDNDAVAESARTWGQIATDEPAARRDYVQQLSPETQAALAAKAKRFAALSPKTREELVVLDQQIAAAPQAARLRATVLGLHDWLTRGDVSPAERATLGQLDSATLARRIAGSQKSEPRWKLSEDQRKNLQAAVAALADTPELNRVPGEIAVRMRQLAERSGNADATRRISEQLSLVEKNPLMKLLLVAAMASEREGPGPMRGFRPEELREHAAEDWRGIEEKLGAALASPRWELVVQRQSREERARLLLWLVMLSGEPTNSQDLSDYIADVRQVSNEEFQRYLDLPTEDMQRELQQDHSAAGLRGDELGGLLGDWLRRRNGGGPHGREPFGPGGGRRFDGHDFRRGPGGPEGRGGPGGPDGPRGLGPPPPREQPL